MPDASVCPHCGGVPPYHNAACPRAGTGLTSAASVPPPFSTYPAPFSEVPPAPPIAPAAVAPLSTAPAPVAAPEVAVATPPEPPAPVIPEVPVQEPLKPPVIPEASDIPTSGVTPSPLASLGLSGDIEAEILDLVRNGMKVRAIRRVREATQMNLGPAKQVVDRLESVFGPPLQARFSPAPSAPPSPPPASCTHCGAVIPADVAACNSCGRPASRVDPPSPLGNPPASFAPHSWFPGYNLPASKEAEICALIMSGRRIQAIAALRDNTRLGLADAQVQINRVALLIGAPRISNTGCYIATACYGDYNHPDVVALRKFRDERLARTAPGRLAVRVYYAVSPAVAHHLGRNTRLASLVRRRILEPIVDRLRTGQ